MARVEERQTTEFAAVARSATNQADVNLAGYRNAKLVVDLATPPAGLVSEVTTVDIGGAVGGTFVLSYDGNDSAAIAFDAVAATVDTLVTAVTGITAVTVTGGGTLVKEVATIDRGVATSGSFTLTVDGEETFPIEFSALAADVKLQLEKLPTVYTVTVTGTGTSGDPWICTFDDPIKNLTITSDDALLVGGVLTVTATFNGVAAVPWVITISTPQQNLAVTGDGALLTGGSAVLGVVETTPGNAGSGSVTPALWFTDEASGTDILLLQGVAQSTATLVELDIGPDVVAVANVAAKVNLPEIAVLKLVHANADELIYSVGAHRHL